MAAGAGSEKFDFFLSRASADGRVARMIASILTKAGRSVLHQDDDAFRHSSFMRMMEQGYDQQRSIALLSPAYQAS
jgi:hypothetical protein